MIKLTKREIRDLEAYGYDTEIQQANPGQEFGLIILISRGRCPLHEIRKLSYKHIKY